MMSIEQLQQNIFYLVDKYTPDRTDLKEVIKNDLKCVKYILAEIDRFKKQEYTDQDIDLIKDIVYYYM